MPDIRNFFGAKGSGSTVSSQEKNIKKEAENVCNDISLVRGEFVLLLLLRCTGAVCSGMVYFCPLGRTSMA